MIINIKGGIPIRKVELSMNEQRKYETIKALVDDPSRSKQRAALVLGCTRRTINRLIIRYQQEGKAAFRHGNKGRKPAHTIPNSVKESIVQLYEKDYPDANFTHFREILEQQEHICISVSALTSILESRYILSPKATKAKTKRMQQLLVQKQAHASTKKEKETLQSNLIALEDAHSRKARHAHFGEQIQMDASPYRWIPDQIWHLHLAVDDATGRPVAGYFDTQETLNGYYHLLYHMLVTYGIPYEIFTDRRTVFTYQCKKSPSIDEDSYTQFGYACKQLGIQLRSSSVPQAKARVERWNETLQSRLPIELRRAGITTRDAANEFLKSYLPKLGDQFSLPIHHTKSVFEKQPSKETINLTLAVLSGRTVDCGHCIQYMRKYYRLLDSRGSQVHFTRGTKVLVIQAFDGSLFGSVGESLFALEQIPERQEKSPELDFDYVPPKAKKTYIPPMSHPWKRASFERYIASQKHHTSTEIPRLML